MGTELIKSLANVQSQVPLGGVHTSSSFWKVKLRQLTQQEESVHTLTPCQAYPAGSIVTFSMRDETLLNMTLVAPKVDT